MQIRIIIMLFFTLLFVLFAVVNIDAVTVDFIFLKAEIKLIYIIISSILFGALFVYVFSANTQRKLKKKIKLLENENKKIKQENDQTNKKVDEQNKNQGIKLEN